MKVIISRKGFDSANGGTASPVMPDGAMLSLPIPGGRKCEKYNELFYDGNSYADIWHSLKPKPHSKLKYCHLDPDLRAAARAKTPKGWVAAYGQCGASETHLVNQNVTIGDLFLFFGWFRKTEIRNGLLKYKRDSKDAHMFFGYLQIGKIVRNDDLQKYYWHPHSAYGSENNTIYVASRHLIINGKNTGLPGAGTFKYSDELVLTKPGMSRSKWQLPDFFKEVDISCHTKENFKPDGYFQSVHIGQEFVVSEDKRVTKWAKNIIVNNFDFSSINI